jgi:FkbM family methyltransferase
MAPRRPLKSLLGRYAPQKARAELYRLRVAGPGDYVRGKWRQATGAAPEPEANAPFDVGGAAPIILHESTVGGIRSHWVRAGQGMRELQAFRQLAPGRSTFLDIGAALGIFSAAFCALTGNTAYAFEPSPEMFEGLAALIGLNPTFKIKPLNLALGAVPGTQQVEMHGAQFRGVSPRQSSATTMNVETLDVWVARHGLTPDFIKIDVEGMEIDVLRGAAKTLSGSVDVIMLELHPGMLAQRSESISDIQALLDRLGFDLFTLDFVPVPDLASHVTDGRRLPLRASNIVCQKRVPAEAGTSAGPLQD